MEMPADPNMLKVSDLMSVEVITVHPDVSLHEAIGLMISNGIRHLPLIRDGKLDGVVSDRNVRMMVTGCLDQEERRRYLSTTPVADHASRPVTTIGPDATAAEAARLFVEARVGCLPVVDEDEHVVGIVTQTDVLKWLARMTED